MGAPMISVVGTSDSGKTTLIEKIIPELTARGLRVGTVKHDVHGFEMDREGKDSYRHKHAGAAATVISAPNRVGMVKDVERELTLDEIGDRFLDDVDVIVVEGYKRQNKPKIEVHRKIRNKPLLSSTENGLVAVATDEPLDVGVPCFHVDDARGLAGFIVDYFHLNKKE